MITPLLSIAGNSATSLMLPGDSDNSPKFSFDINYYSTSLNYTQLEVYYSIPSKELKFIDNSDVYLATITFSITITDINKQVVANKSLRKSLRVNSPDEMNAENQGIIDLILFDLKPGDYFVESILYDENAHKESTVAGIVTVPEFDKMLSISGLQLASIISKNKSNSTFTKGDKSIIPNPSRRYKYQESLLYTYFEIYNLKLRSKSKKAQLQANLYIIDKSLDTLIALPVQSFALSGTSCMLTKSIDIRTLPPDEYTLMVSAKDLTTGEKALQKKSFSIYTTGRRSNQLPMTDKDIKRYRDQIKYFATVKDLKVYDLLDKQGKETFLIDFWHSRDNSPETAENEFMQDCFSRIDYANKNFKGNGSGLNSDMGRVFVIYGQPDEITDHSLDISTKPYVIWEFYTTGKGSHTFSFVDKNGNGTYTLVHSTVEREIHNPNWQNMEL